MGNKTVSYLACPYSHPDPSIRRQRYFIVTRMAYELHAQGKFVYSPLTHNVSLYELSKKTSSWFACELFDKAMLKRCDELLVLALPGWQESKGIAYEMAYAKELNLPIEMIAVKDEILLECC